MKNNDKFLFLDDIRVPLDTYTYTHKTIFAEKNWEIVRSYTEFIEWITKNGLPYFISFDHDLSDVHHILNHFAVAPECQKEKQDLIVLFGW